MTTILYSIAIYFLMAVITYPFILRALKSVKKERIITDSFMAKFMAFTPLINLYVGVLGLLEWYRHKVQEIRCARSIPKMIEALNNIKAIRAKYDTLPNTDLISIFVIKDTREAIDEIIIRMEKGVEEAERILKEIRKENSLKLII